MSILDDEENYFAGTSGSGAFLGSDEDVSISPLFAGLDLNALGIDPNLFAEGLDLNTLLPDIIGDTDVMNALKAQDPAAYAALLSAGEGYGFAPVGGGSPVDAASGVYDPNDQSAAETARLQRQANLTASGQNAVANIGPQGDTGVQSQSADKTGLAKILDDIKKGVKDITGVDAGDLAKYGLLAGIAKLAYDDAEKARKAKLGYIAPGGSAKRAVISPGGSVSYTKAASGGIMSLAGGGFTGTDEDYRNAYKPPSSDYVLPPPVTASRIANLGPGMYYSLQQPPPNLSHSEYLKALAKDPEFIKFKEDNPYAAAEFENMHPAVENRTFNLAKAFEPFHTREQISPNQKFDVATQTFFTPRKNLVGTKIDEYGRTAQDKQKENLYRQLEAIDAWNTTQTTNAGRELLPEERMMVVGVKDDFTGSGPGVLLYDPAKGRNEIVSSGNLSSWFERGDPAAAYEQAKNSLPYFQQKALLGIQGWTTQAQERQIVDALEKNSRPALPFIEYGLGQFAPPNYGLDVNVSRRRAENEQREIKEKPLEYFKDFLNLSPYQGGLPTIYQFPELTGYAEGGMTDKQPFYLGGPTDGMADQIPAHIDNQRPAALSDGEFVIPADVVSHLGNGNSNAGAKRLYEMMDSIREARTGNSEQGKQINPNKFLPR